MKMKYTLKRIVNGKPNKQTLKDCDEGAKAVQSILTQMAWITNKGSFPVMWIMTRFYKRTITKNAIEYDFYLIN